MIKPNCWKLRDYIQSLLDWTIEAEDKNPVCYYFPIDSRDFAKYMKIIEWGHKNDVIPVNLLWKIMEAKKNEEI